MRRPDSYASLQPTHSTIVSIINPSYRSPPATSKHTALPRSHLPHQPNPHSGVRGILRAPSPAGSFLGGFRTPAASGCCTDVDGRHPKPLYGALEVKQRIHGMLFFPSTQFLCSTRKPISSPRPASSECCRAQGLSRLAVAQISRHAPAMPGHTLTAPSTAARSLWSG
jgi:hypothetical protein